MSYHTNYTLGAFKENLTYLKEQNKIANQNIIQEVTSYCETLNEKLNSEKASWQVFQAFWPPRCIEGLINHNAIIFFGAGLSFSCGIPSWGKLLSENFGLDKNFTDDEELAYDPLTLAELASQFQGHEVLQDILRRVMSRSRQYSINHAVLCALRCPYYVTTNYDCLFEEAWNDINTSRLIVVTKDTDLALSEYLDAANLGDSILFKIHGSCDRLDEHMILTRRDYRFHYRTNNLLFEKIRNLLQEKHTIFVGFSHKDPEVSRLVEDAIYKYELSGEAINNVTQRPQFYSLQFDMASHAPEIFAARGIVALQPPLMTTSTEDMRTHGLSIALVDLLAAKERNLHQSASLDEKLYQVIQELSDDITKCLDTLESNATQAINYLKARDENINWLDELREQLGTMASQGIYLLDELGNIKAISLPAGLNSTARLPQFPLNKRPYFQQAKSFRKPFISDSAASIFNSQSTFFFCCPIVNEDRLSGLLFSACQIGQWELPLNIAKRFWLEGNSFILIDSNGVCLLPPLDEFDISAPFKLPENEEAANNIGFNFEKLLHVSRRDILIRHISKNVVPISQDDDVLQLGHNISLFSVISELPKTRWKVAISTPIHEDY